MLTSFNPPWSKVALISCLLTSCFFPAHTKSRIKLSNSWRIWVGMEKNSVQYHNIDSKKMFTTRTLPIKESFLGFQKEPLLLILASCSVKIISDVSLFPIHNRKVKTLSFVHSKSNGLSCLFFHLPMKSPSVFCTLTFAPVSSSCNLSCWKTSFMDLSVVTMIWVSSVYCKIFCSILLIVIQLISLFDRIRFPRTSAMITYRSALSGSPCRTPLAIRMSSDKRPFLLI